MTDNPVSRAIAERGVAVGAMLYEFDTPRVMRILASAGVDFALFDLEHTAWDAGTLRTLYATGLGTGVYPITSVVRAQYTLIATAKLNDLNPQAWLADVLARIADHPVSHLHELLPWHWKATQNQAAAA